MNATQADSTIQSSNKKREQEMSVTQQLAALEMAEPASDVLKERRKYERMHLN